MSSPTSRSLELLRFLGYEAEVVEKIIPGTYRKRDLFGCIDIVAVHARHGWLLVQTTSGSNVAARLRKCRSALRGHPALRHAKVEVWGWQKYAKRGWDVRRETV